MTSLAFSPNTDLSDIIAEAFPNSRADTRQALAMAAGIRRLEPGEMIIRQGDASGVALIIDGHVAVRRTTVDGRQYMIRIVTRGRLSPLLPLLAKASTADAVALTPTTTAVWRADTLRARAKNDAGLAVDILDDVLMAVDEVMGRLDGLLYQNALRRVARVLHQHADFFFVERPILTRAHLPILVGTSREMTGRVLRALEARGTVSRVGRDRLSLLDPAGLATAAEIGADGPRMSPGSPASARRHSIARPTAQRVGRRHAAP
jgi:CRP-like cAMP-binding protein